MSSVSGIDCSKSLESLKDICSSDKTFSGPVVSSIKTNDGESSVETIKVAISDSFRVFISTKFFSFSAASVAVKVRL